jgi:hypothetical protein
MQHFIVNIKYILTIYLKTRLHFQEENDTIERYSAKQDNCSIRLRNKPPIWNPCKI